MKKSADKKVLEVQNYFRIIRAEGAYSVEKLIYTIYSDGSSSFDKVVVSNPDFFVIAQSKLNLLSDIRRQSNA